MGERIWRICPHSGFWCIGTSECTLVPVFGTGEHLDLYPRSGFLYRGHPPKPPFWKPSFCEPPIDFIEFPQKPGNTQGLSGTESAILNRESSDSDSCDSNRAIPRPL